MKLSHNLGIHAFSLCLYFLMQSRFDFSIYKEMHSHWLYSDFAYSSFVQHGTIVIMLFGSFMLFNSRNGSKKEEPIDFYDYCNHALGVFLYSFTTIFIFLHSIYSLMPSAMPTYKGELEFIIILSFFKSLLFTFAYFFLFFFRMHSEKKDKREEMEESLKLFDDSIIYVNNEEDSLNEITGIKPALKKLESSFENKKINDLFITLRMLENHLSKEDIDKATIIYERFSSISNTASALIVCSEKRNNQTNHLYKAEEYVINELQFMISSTKEKLTHKLDKELSYLLTNNK